MPKTINLKGLRFGRLVVGELAEDYIAPNGGIVKQQKCKCDCGNEVIVRSSYLRSGKTRSCGCYRKEVTKARHITHGKAKTRINNIYHGMKYRCYATSCPNYKDYGGRGITICDEWLGELGFEHFYDWAIKNGYDDNLSIDRINNDRDYSPGNCRWATVVEQANNKRNNRTVTVNGITHSLHEWAEISGIRYNIIVTRLHRGWNEEKAVTFPVKNDKRRNKTDIFYA